jgi:hypothetical protein
MQDHHQKSHQDQESTETPGMRRAWLLAGYAAAAAFGQRKGLRQQIIQLIVVFAARKTNKTTDVPTARFFSFFGGQKDSAQNHSERPLLRNSV